MLSTQHVQSQLTDLAAAATRLARDAGDGAELGPMLLAGAVVQLDKLQRQLHKVGKAIAPPTNGDGADKPKRPRK